MLYANIFTETGSIEFHAVREYEDRDGGKNLLMHIERSEDRKSFSDWRLPDISCIKSYGFSEDELFRIEDYLAANESIIWDDFRREAGSNA